MTNDEAELYELAGAIIDGAPIDWMAVEAGAGDASLQAVIRDLRVIAAIADVHGTRVLPADGDGDDVPVRLPPEGIASWGPLRLLEKVGAGACGEVYRAWDTRLDREVALKLRPAGPGAADGRASSIVEEGRLLARVRHPNVVTIYGAERLEERIGLWMEFVRGRTLEQVLEEGPISGEETIRIGLELCRAVAAVHGAGLLHRDIKSQNVMLADDGRVVLMDFGSGRDLGDGPGQGLAGTPLYIAPELLRGEPAGASSDVYALGVLLFHLLTGTFPVRAAGLAALRLAHERGERVDVRTVRPSVDRRLAGIVGRAIEPDPERRFRSADALERDLRRLSPGGWLGRAGSALAFPAILLLVTWLGLEWRASVTGGTGPLGLLLSEAPQSAMALPPAADRPVLVVLPFDNLGGDPENDYLVEGLTVEILHRLAAVEGLQVRARDSAFAVRTAATSLAEVGRQLQANLILLGTARRSGTRLLVNARLVRTDGTVLWSEEFDRGVEDIFAVQDEIAQAIVNRLRLTPGRGRGRYSTGIEAYDLYLKGRALIASGGTRNLERAAELFEKALHRDPDFAPAHAGLANAYAMMSLPLSSIQPFASTQAIIRSAATRALQLDPLLAEAHAALGWAHARERDWQDADASFRRALELDPSLSQTYTDYSVSTLQPLGRDDDALHLLEEALRNDPLSLSLQREIGSVQLVAGRYDEAVATLERIRAVQPDIPFVETYLGRALAFAGRLEEGRSVLEGLTGHHLGRYRTPGATRAAWLAQAYVMAGRREDAESLALEHRRSPSALATIYAALGERSRAFDALEQLARDQPHHLGRTLRNPELAPLRGDPRFAALREQAKLPRQ